MKAPATRPVSSFKVLVIDDQQQMRQIIRESLYRLGIRNVVMAGNAREALKAMQVENVDVVLSDYNLGEGTDGQQLLEVARSTKVLNPTAPWIFITANSLRTDVLAAGDFTPDGYIVKPFTDQQQALQDLQHAKRSADFIRAIELGESALAVSPANFHIQIELCTLYLVAMGRACGKPEHAMRAKDLLTALDRKHPNHTRVAAARKFYRERLASPVTAA